MGPGLPLGFGMPSLFGADRFTPFFLGFSVGGPIEDAPGVPSAAGVAAFESDALSPLAAVDGMAAESSGEALTSAGDSSFLGVSESSSLDSSSDEILSVTIMLDLLPDLRRPSVEFLLGAIEAMCCNASTIMLD